MLLIAILVIIILLLVYLWKTRETLVSYNNSVFEPLPDGISENNIYTDGIYYYLVQRDPTDPNNYQKRIISGKDAGLLGTPEFRGTNKNINLLRDGLPLYLTENTVVRRFDGRMGRVVNGEFKQWTHQDSYNKAGSPAASEENYKYDVDKLQYILPNNIYTYGLMAGPTWMIDSNKF